MKQEQRERMEKVRQKMLPDLDLLVKTHFGDLTNQEFIAMVGDTAIVLIRSAYKTVAHIDVEIAEEFLSRVIREVEGID